MYIQYLHDAAYAIVATYNACIINLKIFDEGLSAPLVKLH